MHASFMAPAGDQGFGQKLMLIAGLLAGGGFAFVSIAANMRFGVSLATSPLDRIIYTALSIAADLIKIALPLVVAILWRNGERMFAFAGAVFWIGAVAFSICAAIGFAASTRSHMLTTGEQQIEKRRAWEAKIVRTEEQIDLLGVHRPASVIQADIDILLRTAGADDCTVVNGPVTREVCPKIDRLKRELAASREAGRLEEDLVADRETLSTIPVPTMTADPQSAALGELTGFGEGAIRNSVAVLIALLVELGSALGFTLIILAARANAANLGASIPPDALQSAFVLKTRRQHPQAGLHLSDFPTDLVTRWALARLDVISSEVIQAEHAYEDFRDWCCAQGARALTPQMFGRRFTAIHKGMGGKKLKRQGRAYYSGVTLQAQRSAGIKDRAQGAKSQSFQ